MYEAVYKITCSVTHKTWIGKTKLSLHLRWRNHVNDARRGLYHNHPFYDDIRKYGQELFSVEIIRYRATKRMSLNSERFYIHKYNSLVPNGYNILLGQMPLPSTRKKLSIASKRYWSKATSKQISENSKKLMIGCKRWRNSLTPEQRRQHNKKLSAAAKKRWNSPKSNSP